MNNKMTEKEYDSLLASWKEIFDTDFPVYIYGAALTAKKMLKLAEDTGVKDKVAGFLVTDKEKNPEMLEKLPVKCIYDFDDKESIILIPHLGVYKAEIGELLSKLGYHKVVFSDIYLNLIRNDSVVEINDEYMEMAQSRIDFIQSHKTEEEKANDKIVSEHILDILKEGRPDFGSVRFYQSCELIGVFGQRPSLYRVFKYGLDKILNKNQSVLDIGCNSGFLDICIADNVKNTLGIEFDAVHVKIANIVKDYLKIENCNFINGDAVEWAKSNQMKFDVIFAFAIHHWLRLESQEFVKMCDELLNREGYLCFESHDVVGSDAQFDECCRLFSQKGYVAINEGVIKDDGYIERKFVVYCKS